MTHRMIGRALAALLLLGTASAAHASGYYMAPGAGGAASPNSDPIAYDSGYTYATNGAQFGPATSVTNNRLSCGLVSYRASVGITALGSRVTTSGSGGNFASAVYADQFFPGVGHRPVGAPLGATGDITATSYLGMGSVAAVNGAAGSTFNVLRNTRYWQCFVTNSSVAFSGTGGGSGTTLGGVAAAADVSNLMPTSATGATVVYMAMTYPTANTATSWPAGASDGSGWTALLTTHPVTLFTAQ